MFMNDYECEKVAAALYDGGWRSSDFEELLNHPDYGFTVQELDAVCNYLRIYEESDQQ